MARPAQLPPLASCRVACRDFRLHRFKVAVQAERGWEAARGRALKALTPLQDPQTGLLQVVDDARAAAWVVRVGEKCELLEGSGNPPPYPLPPVEDADFAGRLCDGLEKVFRARSLVAVCERLERARSHDGGIAVAVDVCVGKAGKERLAVRRPAGGWVFRPGDQVSFRLRNRSQSAPIDVQMLKVEPDFKILPFYPTPGEEPKALAPGASVESEAGEVDDEPPFGQEFLLVIATPAKGPRVDFRLLAQPGLRKRNFAQASPLDQLLWRALFREGNRSGLDDAELSQAAVQVLSWRTEPLRSK
jgi:hypothetical protein